MATTIEVPPCQAACPIHTNVRGYVAAIAKGDAEEAIRIVRQVNPFPSVCGRICTRPCESKCRRAQADEAVSIRALKRFAADQTRGLAIIEKPVASNNEKIAIIGSGPSGLTAAHDLVLLGYKVTVYEAQQKLGGMLSEGIPDYRLPKDLVQAEIDRILALGVVAKTGVSLGKDFTIEGLLKDNHAVFLAVGSQKGIVPKCHGSELEGIIPGVAFLKQVSRGQEPAIGRHIAVIGGGHTAIDAARTCIRLGVSEVTVIYRRTIDEMPAGRDEVAASEQEGVRFYYLASPVAFLGEGHVQKLRCIRMQLGEPDPSGRRRPVPIENSEFEMEADMVILAIGYTPDTTSLKESGLNINRNGTVIVKDETGTTNLSGVFAAGDVVSGPQSVIDAIASGRKVADSIHRHFRGLQQKEQIDFHPLEPLDKTVVERIDTSIRQEYSLLPAEERIRSFEEVEVGFSPEQAIKEAQRCLNCGAGAHISDACASCLNCVRVCPYGVPSPGKDMAEIDMSQCQACGICASECPASAITLNFENAKDSVAEIEKTVTLAREETPDILILGFYCRYQSPLGPPADRDNVYWIGKCCTGRMDVKQIIYPVEIEAEGVALFVCENDRCRFRDGDKYLKKHVNEARKLLDETGIGSERISIISGEEEMDAFRNTLETLGINPLRTGKKVKA
jgi:NADPH-dependent glutamate synthase beta subunit-like oxidoreductase/coenzyme F420-reducing hydrogenase delta subunit